MSDTKYKFLIIAHPIALWATFFIFTLMKYPKGIWTYTPAIVLVFTALMISINMPEPACEESVPEKLMLAMITEATAYGGTAVYFWMGGNWRTSMLAFLITGTIICTCFGFAVFTEDEFILRRKTKEDTEREKLIRNLRKDEEYELSQNSETVRLQRTGNSYYEEEPERREMPRLRRYRRTRRTEDDE